MREIVGIKTILICDHCRASISCFQTRKKLKQKKGNRKWGKQNGGKKEERKSLHGYEETQREYHCLLTVKKSCFDPVKKYFKIWLELNYFFSILAAKKSNNLPLLGELAFY